MPDLTFTVSECIIQNILSSEGSLLYLFLVMKRKLFVFLGSVVLLTVLLSFSAWGDYSFNDVQSGTEIAFTVGVSTPDGSPKTVTGVLSAGMPEGTTASLTEDGRVFISGKPLIANEHIFILTLSYDSGETEEITCALNVLPAVPFIYSQPAAQSIGVGETAILSVGAEVASPESNILSYQWFSCAYDGSAALPIDGATDANLPYTSSESGQVFLFCRVTCTNNGYSSFVDSDIVKVDSADVSLVSVAVNRMPYKLDYTVGEALDTSGLELRLFYSTGEKRDITEGFICSPMILDSSGTQSITVSYESLACTFNVSVNEAEEKISAIQIASKPYKLTYKTGEQLNTSGLSLTVYTNLGQRTADSGYTCTPQFFTEPSARQAVKVSYGGFECSFYVVVIEAVPASSAPTAEPDNSVRESPVVITVSPDKAAEHNNVRSERNSSLTATIVIIALISLLGLGFYVVIMQHGGWDEFLADMKELIDSEKPDRK